MVLALLAEAAKEATGPGVPFEIIAFVAGSAGTVFGGGVAFGIFKKRFEDAEKAIAAAAEACKTATQNTAKITELENRVPKLKDRVETLEVENGKLRSSLLKVVAFMRHSDGVPNQVLDDISDVLESPQRRLHQDSI